MEFSMLKGFKDIIPSEITIWQTVEAAARKLFESYGFHEIKTPLLEKRELFARGIGQETDIVSKEMYCIEEAAGDVITLRPEATAGVVRAYIQHQLYVQSPVQKLFTIGPMFRRERPQKGRYRQFHQINAEMFGDPGPRSDADIISMAFQLLEILGLENLSLKINSLGCSACRPAFMDTFSGFLANCKNLCGDCIRRSQKNPLRVFDCKVNECKDSLLNAPSILNFLCNECKVHFDEVREYLDLLSIPYHIDAMLVRGLDYYTRTAFEIQTDQLGAQNAVAGGGRYDGLVRILGGPDQPAIGFAVGMERIAALMEQMGKNPGQPDLDLFIACLGKEAFKEVLPIIKKLRYNGISAEMDYGNKSLKSQMKSADRLKARYVLILGDTELNSGIALLRFMSTGEQKELSIKNLTESLGNLFSVC